MSSAVRPLKLLRDHNKLLTVTAGLGIIALLQETWLSDFNRRLDPFTWFYDVSQIWSSTYASLSIFKCNISTETIFRLAIVLFLLRLRLRAEPKTLVSHSLESWVRTAVLWRVSFSSYSSRRSLLPLPETSKGRVEGEGACCLATTLAVGLSVGKRKETARELKLFLCALCTSCCAVWFVGNQGPSFWFCLLPSFSTSLHTHRLLQVSMHTNTRMHAYPQTHAQLFFCLDTIVMFAFLVHICKCFLTSPYIVIH